MNTLTKSLFILLSLLLLNSIVAQETFPKNGVYDKRDGWYAFTNATIYTQYNQKLENASLVIYQGKVQAVGQNIAIPEGAVIIDLEGKYIYPSFIDLFTDYGQPEAKAVGERPKKQPQALSNKEGAYSWNEALKSEFSAYQHFKVDDKTAKSYRDQGFGTVMSHRKDGISRGSGALVLLGKGREHELILQEAAAHVMSFRKGTSTQNYPSSLMGAIALLRQTYYDAQWYKEVGHQSQSNISLEAWNELQGIPQIFDVGNRLEVLRAAKIAKEFGLNYIYEGRGDEYRRMPELKALGASFIIPLNFPKAYDVEDPFDALQVELADLIHWELAPTNPAHLAKNDIDFSFTMNGLKKKGDFWTNLRKCIDHGLSKTDALKALTHTPAQLMGAKDHIGSLEKGKLANFIICSEDIFEAKAVIHHNWIRGKAHVIKSLVAPKFNGVYELQLSDSTYQLHVSSAKGKLSTHIQVNDSTKIKVKNQYNRNLITLSFQLSKTEEGTTSLSGSTEARKWMGRGTLADGTWINWSAQRSGDLPTKEEKKEEKKEADKIDPASLAAIPYPFSAYGWTELPTAKSYLIKDATVWTNEAEGILSEADVLIEDGKIAKVGKDLNSKKAIIIDGKGKHLTSGIIDEHSHIAISRGVNEGTQASSAEVSIADVVNSEDINIYRQLAGGVTTAQLLHGSANPIGGQSAIIKFRWGFVPEEMKFKAASPFIKFALGENVKQSNWGDEYSIRFPQTRMGVEQVFEDYFTRAREYETLKKSGRPYRKDLDLEAVLEIINSERFISCHSYQQGEINMLMKVADKHGFTVNTFTHILEGYKVADKMKVHGVAGSTFSDWWAYKYEVIDAIPHNGAIMHEQGVLTAFNSDDAEMARRLNQEAGKAVQYGGVPEEEAWKFVTLNPAKILHIDKQVGSIKVGKDADIVLWSDHPMSIYAKADMTWVDGIRFFDREEDRQKREIIRKERARLIQKSIKAKKGGASVQAPKARKRHHYHCDHIQDEMK
ncbi:MAG: amidohydrolase family protein [Bacteroidota bacterium]